MCMLVGNDFLPHAPHLEIDSGALSLMMSNYIDLLPVWKGYLTNRDKIHPQRLEEFLYNLSIYEEEHFKRRGLEENEPGWKLSAEEETLDDDFYGEFYSGAPTPDCAMPANKEGAEPPPAESRPMAPTADRSFRRKYPDKNFSRSYRDFYYDLKLGWKTEDRCRTLFQRRNHVREYLKGLHWNLNYYHNGCQSWDWFFPYMYAPLATDMVNLAEFYECYGPPDEDGFCRFDFEMGTPFPPLGQLLSVLPPQSAKLLPKALAELMIHPASPLLEYYPMDFTSDPNGKRQSWEAVVQIPFIEADILLDTVGRVLDSDDSDNDDDSNDNDQLSPAERRRNTLGKQHTYKPAGITDEEKEQLAELKKAAVVSGRMPSRGNGGGGRGRGPSRRAPNPTAQGRGRTITRQ
eukprot:Plantae.Rhodophyta-Palmaria_palmata.ctg6624.p1 GENE.Plantae.Rhodophyta-Palmaria_palmata.ctg6624~~Plantae.Rhodophyta-Palmaria_palmata.ctg6624.p1  ORF type:complete len:466 (+),score=61.47 Plantae.Rhodophyta-Palmaria_palmata.ctg6624:188-1399(+)